MPANEASQPKALVASTDAAEVPVDDASEVAAAAPEDRAEAANEEPGQVVYRAELELPLSLKLQVSHLEWTCRDGSCSARGQQLNISGKSCVQLGATLGSVVKRFEHGGELLEGRHLEYCQTTLRRLDQAGKLREARARNARAESVPQELAAGETYLEVTAKVGQMWLRGDGLRFAFPDGAAVLLTQDGEVYRFDAEQRLLEHGRFVRWHSVRGYYVSNEVLSPAIRDRCSRTNGGVVIEPWQIRHDSSTGPACHPHREDFQLVFVRSDAITPKQKQTAQRAAYAAPYANDRGWKPPLARTSKAPIQVVVGSVRSVPGYHQQPARDMLEKVQEVVDFCARYRHDPSAETKGTLVLFLGAFGKPKTALVRRTTYPEPERMSACIEQRVMQQTFQTTYDVLAQIPFQVLSK